MLPHCRLYKTDFKIYLKKNIFRLGKFFVLFLNCNCILSFENLNNLTKIAIGTAIGIAKKASSFGLNGYNTAKLHQVSKS